MSMNGDWLGLVGYMYLMRFCRYLLQNLYAPRKETERYCIEEDMRMGCLPIDSF